MKRILVGVDGSPESKRAAAVARTLAEALKTELVLAYVVAPFTPPAPEMYIPDPSGREQADRAYGAGVLHELAARCSSGGVAVKTKLEAGPVAETLARVATEAEVELVAVGHRGRGAMKRLLLGSVADRLAQICTRPVLICRD